MAPTAVVETLGGLKGAVQPARIYILPPRPCKYWRDVEFRVYFKRFIWRESRNVPRSNSDLYDAYSRERRCTDARKTRQSPRAVLLPRLFPLLRRPSSPASSSSSSSSSSSFSKKLQVILNNNRYFTASFFQGQEMDVPPAQSPFLPHLRFLLSCFFFFFFVVFRRRGFFFLLAARWVHSGCAVECQ